MHLRLRLLLTFNFFTVIVFTCNAQSISRSAIGTAGVNFQKGPITLQSIAGQSSLTENRHGFIQPHGLPLNLPQRSVTVFPNPTQSFSVISGVAKGDRITIYSSDGRVLESITCESFIKQPLSLDGLPNGVYLIKVQGVFEYNNIKLIKTN